MSLESRQVQLSGDADLSSLRKRPVGRVVDDELDALEALRELLLDERGDRFHVAELSASIEEVIDAAINNAKIARDNINPEAKIYCDIAPTGKLLEPLGDLSFDDAYEAFKEQVIAADKKVDGFIIETFSDLYEMKAAILAVKENSDLPVISSCTFTSSGNMLTGASPLQMVTLLEALDVVGD